MFSLNSSRSGQSHDEATRALEVMSRKRTVLIGTVQSVGQLQYLLKVLNPAPTVVGCLLPANAVNEAEVSLPILGDFNELGELIAHHIVEQAFVSLPMAMSSQAQKLGQVLDRMNVTWRFLPTLADQLAGRVPIVGVGGSANIRTNTNQNDAKNNEAQNSGASGPSFWTPVPLSPWMIDPQVLLDRKPRPLDESAIRSMIEGRTIMLTGAGGSIGSELAKAVCRFKPGRIVLLERAENSLFEIDRQIGSVWPEIPRSAVLHDVTDASRTLAVVMSYKPSVIFHAAAHKHVPMMEEHPSAAMENNFFGTRSIADAASKCGVDRFVMTSSDKAVNPSSVMGASKRLAELYLQYLNARSETIFSMVRFGNVLGSACSVIPIWAQQLASGGPLTVTHPDMTRYFMTIPEAAGLVLQSAAYSGGEYHVPGSPDLKSSGGGEVFLLDMGKPICILDLARRFIVSQGLEPDVDIKIQFSGIRPGEKLFEELAYNSEAMIPTPHPSLRIWQSTPPDAAKIQQIVSRFDELRGQPSADGHRWQFADKHVILAAIHDSVPEMVAPSVAAVPVPGAGEQALRAAV